jgi:hypothetical protein
VITARQVVIDPARWRLSRLDELTAAGAPVALDRDDRGTSAMAELSDLLPGPEFPSPTPARRCRHSDDQLATLERAQGDVQRPRRELELGRELRGRDGARVAGGDHVERRLLAGREVIGGIAGQRIPCLAARRRTSRGRAL